MTFMEYSRKMELLKQSVELAHTGRPARLAKKLGLTERTLLRMVQQLRDQGYPISFNRSKNSYENLKKT